MAEKQVSKVSLQEGIIRSRVPTSILVEAGCVDGAGVEWEVVNTSAGPRIRGKALSIKEMKAQPARQPPVRAAAAPKKATTKKAGGKKQAIVDPELDEVFGASAPAKVAAHARVGAKKAAVKGGRAYSVPQ